MCLGLCGADSSVTRMSASEEQPPADMVEDDVMNQLPTLNEIELEEICELIGVTVEDNMKGNRRVLLKTLMRYLCTSEAEDDKLTAFLQIHTHLNRRKEDEDEEENDDKGTKDDVAVVKEEPVAIGSADAGKTPLTKSVRSRDSAASKDQKDPSQHRSGKKGSVAATVDVTRVRLKEFKLLGMIGGTGENSLSYTSLQFEIDKGKKLGHSDMEMCSAVISKVADKELRSYFETEPDIKLEEVLDMLKSTCTEQEKERTARAVFTKFSNDKQGKSEKPITFITRVLRLRKKVLKLGKEERMNYDEDMLATTSFQVIFSGLRDENIRAALRGKCKDDCTISDQVLLKHASEIIAAEEERKLKLFGKEPEAELEVSAVAEKKSVSFTESALSKKEKPNPFAKIEELRLENEKMCEGLRAELSEIKDILVASNLANNQRGGNNNLKQDQKKNTGNKGRRFGRCAKCIEENKHKCFHCWDCGQDDHKRGAQECPENE